MLQKKICPTGFRIPSKDDWSALVTFLGGTGAASDKLKEAGTTYWNAPNNGTNSSGFSSRGAGEKWNDGMFSNLKIAAYYWSSTPVDGTNAWAFSGVTSSTTPKRRGQSVRCVADVASLSSGLRAPGAQSPMAWIINPATKKVSLTLPDGLRATRITLLDLSGSRMLADAAELDLSGVRPGLYLIEAEVDGSLMFGKIVVP